MEENIKLENNYMDRLTAAHMDALHKLIQPLKDCKNGHGDITSRDANYILQKWDIARIPRPIEVKKDEAWETYIAI